MVEDASNPAPRRSKLRYRVRGSLRCTTGIITGWIPGSLDVVSQYSHIDQGEKPDRPEGLNDSPGNLASARKSLIDRLPVHSRSTTEGMNDAAIYIDMASKTANTAAPMIPPSRTKILWGYNVECGRLSTNVYTACGAHTTSLRVNLSVIKSDAMSGKVFKQRRFLRKV
jgi:hypothetical protein